MNREKYQEALRGFQNECDSYFSYILKNISEKCVNEKALEIFAAISDLVRAVSKVGFENGYLYALGEKSNPDD